MKKKIALSIEHMWKWIKCLFKPKRELRDICVELYGDKFGEEYDKLNQGIPIGGLEYTIDFLNKLEKVKSLYDWK